MNGKKKKSLNKDMKVFFIVAALVLAVIAFFIIKLLFPADDKVATIKGNVISSTEFKYYYTQQVNQALIDYNVGVEYTEQFLASPVDEAGQTTVEDMLKKQTFELLKLYEMLAIKAEEEGFTYDKAEIENEWKTFENGIESASKNNNISKQELSKIYFGVDFKKIEKIYKDYIMRQKFLEKKMADAQIDETELAEFYTENHKFFDSAVVRHILIEVAEDASDEVAAEQERLANDVLGKVNAGDDFTALVEEYSADDGSIQTGGMYEMGYGQMVTEFEEWTFSHEPGDTGIVKTKFGFHVMKLDSIKNTLEANREAAERAFRYDAYTGELLALMETDEYKVIMVSGYDSF